MMGTPKRLYEDSDRSI